MPPRPEPFDIVEDTWRGRTVHFRRDFLILKVIPPTEDDADILRTIDTVLQSYVPSYDIRMREGAWAYIQLPAGTDVPALAEDLAAHPSGLVAYAEPDLAMRFAGYPEDPLIDSEYTDAFGEVYKQWGITYLDMDVAWGRETGNDRVLIGLIDTGIWIRNECLDTITYRSRLDGCLAHSDLDGKRFIAGNNYMYTPPAPPPFDEIGHGTNMAGILSATANNGEGIAGMNWHSPVYVCRAADENNETTAGIVYLAVKEIIEYANLTKRKAVINLSANFEDDIEGLDLGTLEDLVSAAAIGGPILVCAVGNQGEDVRFPATLARDHPNCMVSVGAICGDSTIWWLSNYDKSRVAAAPAGTGAAPQEPAVSVVAPGDDIATTTMEPTSTTDPIAGYDVASGTSEATAHVTGLISLMWSLNPGMTAAQVIQCLKRTAVIPGEIIENWPSSEGEPSYKYGYGIINAVKALERVDWEVTLETPQIDLEDVPAGAEPSREIRLAVRSCARVSFQVTVTGHDFGIAEGTYYHHPGDGPVFNQLIVTYSAGLPDTASARVSIQWLEKPALAPFIVEITANRAGVQNSAVVLAIDKSESMNRRSGIDVFSRMRVAKYSSGVLVDLIETNSAMGIVSFNEAAHHVADVTVIDPAEPNAARVMLKTRIGQLEASGSTSIGAGIQRAGLYLDGIPPDLIAGEETKAVIVLTDGKENRAPLISEILSDGFAHPVYAIGVGTADTIDVAALGALCEATGGNLLVTDGLSGGGEDLIASFFAKILAEINGDSTVLDPTHRLRPDHRHEYPVKVTTGDERLDVTLIRPPGAAFDVEMITPDGASVSRSSAGVSVIEGTWVSRYRMSFADAGPSIRSSYAGLWRTRMSISRTAFDNLLASLKSAGVDPHGLAAHGVRYTLQAQVKSNLRMRARLHQTGYEPGAVLLIRAVIGENERPLRDPAATVTAVVREPDGVLTMTDLVRRAPGMFEAGFTARIPGVYFVTVTAEGCSRTGDKYRREAFLTGAIHHAGVAGRP